MHVQLGSVLLHRSALTAAIPAVGVGGGHLVYLRGHPPNLCGSATISSTFIVRPKFAKLLSCEIVNEAKRGLHSNLFLGLVRIATPCRWQ
jgi:hypothetical protein